MYTYTYMYIYIYIYVHTYIDHLPPQNTEHWLIFVQRGQIMVRDSTLAKLAQSQMSSMTDFGPRRFVCIYIYNKPL